MLIPHEMSLSNLQGLGSEPNKIMTVRKILHVFMVAKIASEGYERGWGGRGGG